MCACLKNKGAKVATLLRPEGLAFSQTMHIAWVGEDALFWQGAKALLSPPSFMLSPACIEAEQLRLGDHLDVVDLVIWDVGSTPVAGLVALTQAWPWLAVKPVLVVCADMDEATFKGLLALGVSGVLSKQIEGHYLVQSVRHVLAGQKAFAPEYRAFVQDPQEQLFQTLTAREREILGYLAQGVSNKAIAEALTVAPSTVKVHVQNILRKLQLNSRVQAAVYAIRQQS